MPRPTDLPQPVREHPNHQLPLNCKDFSSPGPSAYEGYGVTTFDRDHRGGIFGASRSCAQIPTKRGPMQSSQGTTTTPGPIYDVSGARPFSATKINTTFGRAKRFTRYATQSNLAPGPGNYFDSGNNGNSYNDQKSAADCPARIQDRFKVSSSVGTFSRARRVNLTNTSKGNDSSGAASASFAISSSSNAHSPSSAEYSPNVAPTKIHHGGSTFPHSTIKGRMSSKTAAQKHCETTDVIMAGHEELDRADTYTKHQHRGVSIPRATRGLVDRNGGDFRTNNMSSSSTPGVGSYDELESSKVIAKQSPSIGFTRGSRSVGGGFDDKISRAEYDHRQIVGGRQVGGGSFTVLPSTLSNKGVRLSPHRGASDHQHNNNVSPNNNNNSRNLYSGGSGGNDLGPSYDPDVTFTRPNRNRGCSMSRAQRFNNRVRSGGASVEFHDISNSTLVNTSHGGSRVGSAKRFAMSAEEREWFQHPSAAEYSPQLPKRPESATRSIMDRHEKVGRLLQESRETPGPKYDSVDMNLVRQPLARPVSFPRSQRGLLENNNNKDSSTPGVGTYNVNDSMISKTGPSAVLYLGG